jgi:excisionase family DNA binding protein
MAGYAHSQQRARRRRNYPGLLPRYLQMSDRNISDRECKRRAHQRAMSIDEFCRDYGVGRTTAYEELNAGRLRARKCGKRTIITADAAEDWLRALPTLEPTAA